MICLSNSIKFSYLWVNSDYINYSTEGLENYYNQETRTELRFNCNVFAGEEKESCISSSKDYLGGFVSNTYDLKEKIKQVPKTTEILYVFGQPGIVYDFSNLQSQMSVFFFSDETGGLHSFTKNIQKSIKTMSKIKFDGSPTSLSKFGHELGLKKSINTPTSTETIIKGQVKGKITTFGIFNTNITFQGDLECVSLYINDCSISTNSGNIKSTYMIVEENTHKKFIYNKRTYTFEKIQCEQYLIAVTDSNTRSMPYYVALTFDYDSLIVTKIIIDYYSYTYYLPYELADSLGVDVRSEEVKIYANKPVRSSYKNANISISKNIIDEPICKIGKLNLPDKVTISADRTWNDVPNRPKFFVTVNEDEFNVDLSSARQYLDISLVARYKEKKKKSNKKLIIAIVFGSIASVALIAVIVFLIFRKTKDKVTNEFNSDSDTERIIDVDEKRYYYMK